MAITRTDRGPFQVVSGSGSGQSASTASFTPTNGRVLVVVGYIASLGTNTDISVSDSWGSAVDAWTVVKSNVGVAYSTAAIRAFAAWAYVSGSPGSGTITVTRTTGSGECVIVGTALEFAGVDTANPFRQYAANASTGGGASLSTNLSSSPLSANYLVGAGGDFWGSLALPSALTLLDAFNFFGNATIVHETTGRTGEDSTPSGTSYSWTGLNGDATAAILVEIQEPQSVSDTAPAATATASVAAYSPTVTSAQDAAAEAATAAVAANDATIVTLSSTPNPSVAEASVDVFAPKLRVDATAGVAAATAAALDGDASPLIEVHADASAASAIAFDTIGDSVEPPIVVPVSDTDLLELNVSQRREAFRFDLLDAAGNVVGEVHPRFPVKIANSTTQAIKRRMTGFQLAPDEYREINTLVHRVRPVMVLQNGSEYPLGVFLFADETTAQFSYGSTLDGTLVDRSLILAQPIMQTISFAQDTLVVDAIREVYELAGVHDAVIDSSSAVLGSPVAWPVGKSTTYVKVLDELAALAGFYNPYFDNAGVPRCRVAVDLSVSTPTLVYDDGGVDSGRIIAGSIVRSNDLLQAPNRFIVTDTSATVNGVVAVYDLPPSAPHAVAHRGWAIPEHIDAPGIGNTDQALELAKLRAQTATKTFESVNFQSPTDPRHDTYDVVSFLGNVYMEIGWALTCSPGGPMEHELNRQYVA